MICCLEGFLVLENICEWASAKPKTGVKIVTCKSQYGMHVVQMFFSGFSNEFESRYDILKWTIQISIFRVR